MSGSSSTTSTVAPLGFSRFVLGIPPANVPPEGVPAVRSIEATPGPGDVIVSVSDV